MNYNPEFLFEWDIAKSERCLEERVNGSVLSMKTQRLVINSSVLKGQSDLEKLNSTSEQDIEFQAKADDEDAAKDAGKHVVRIRRRLGLSQSEFSKTIDVSVETIRNWEQGKRSPTGAAKALLKILDKAPDVALCALR